MVSRSTQTATSTLDSFIITKNMEVVASIGSASPLATPNLINMSSTIKDSGGADFQMGRGFIRRSQAISSLECSKTV